MFKITRSPFLGLTLWLKSRGLDRLINAVTPKDIKNYYQFLEESVAERRILEETHQAGNDDTEKKVRQDMFHFLYQAQNLDTGAQAFSNKAELYAEVNLLVIAGSDTTAINLCSFFFYLTRHSHVYAKVVAEIRSTFTSPEEIVGGAKLSSCAYLRACLDETLRLTSVVVSDLPRTILPGGQEIDGDIYPAGIQVGVSDWASSRDDSLGDPNVFRPERWIVSDEQRVTAADVAHLKSCVHPFSAGPANCVGQNLALLELLTTIGRTLWRLDVRAAPGDTLGEGREELGWGRRDPKQYQLTDAYVAMREGPMVQFKKRGS